VQAQYGAVDAVGQLAPVTPKSVKALAQGRAGGHGAQAQRLVGKALAAKALDGLEVVLAQGEQGQVALEYVAVGDAATHRVLRIDHGGQVDALEQAPDQGQATVAAQIVGQLLDNEFNRISHVHFLHPQGEQQIWAKCLLYIGNCHFFVGEVTDSG